jgi:type IX secretion system PorP/SprF family membrane protein
MKTFIRTSLVLVALSFPLSASHAQLNPFGAMYFHNPYLNNPAMAGLHSGVFVNMGARRQWAALPGAPATQVLTAEYGKGKVGIGLNLNNDAAGLLKRTRVMGSYAYHLPLNDKGASLSFGISLGSMNERIESSQVRGDAGDISVGRYNSRETYVDGDFGMAITASRLVIQVAVPNVKSFFNRDQRNLGADHATFLAAASYRVPLVGDLQGAELEPTLCFRGVNGFHNIIDAGTGLWLDEKKLLFQAIYHSTKSATLGMALNYWPRISILGIYTTETADLRTYASGNFEIGLRVKAF